MATSLELVRALRRRGVHLSLAGGDMISNELTLLHLANCVSDAPFRWDCGAARRCAAVGAACCSVLAHAKSRQAPAPATCPRRL